MFNIGTQYGKSLVAGGLAGLVHVIGLFVLYEFVGIHYLVASGIAFVGAIFVNFYFQKRWVFESSNKTNTHIEFMVFAITAIVYLLLNTLLLYVGVNYMNLYYLIAQLLVIGGLSIINFYVYKKIFKSLAKSDV